MRSTNGVEDTPTRKARLKGIRRFLSRRVSALSRARTRVRRRRHDVAPTCAASAGLSQEAVPVSIEDSRVPLIDVSKGCVVLVFLHCVRRTQPDS